MSAFDAVAALRAGELRSTELIEAAVARIERVEGEVNALPTLCVERALSRAADPGLRETPLAGLPIAIKDLHEVAGVRTTYGSPIFADHTPERSALQVERLERAGAIVLAKSNTPEFGAGAQTFNPVFGATRNPWNTQRTCGGSSGGSAVALATGEVWLADGSDLGGSLRTPAAFCGVVGLRPSPGSIAGGLPPVLAQDLSVCGPMARDVRDLCLMLDAMVGLDGRDPLSRAPDASSFLDAARAAKPPRRVAFSADLGGLTPVQPEVARIAERAARRFEELGCEVIEAAPDFDGAIGCFATLRAELFVSQLAPLLVAHRDRLKPDVVWNIEKGLALDANAIGAAERARARMRQSALELLETVDLFCCPAAIVEPFDVETKHVAEVNGHAFESYVDWLAITSAITLTGLPALSLPAGWSESALPIGLQLIGGPRGEAALLSAAAALEAVLGGACRAPIDPRGPGAAPRPRRPSEASPH